MKNVEEEQGRPGNFRDFMLNGRTPEKFIQDRVKAYKEWHQGMVKKGTFKGEYTNYDLAELLYSDIASEITTQEEMERSLPSLGFSQEEATKFLEETSPQMQQLLRFKTRGPSIKIRFQKKE